MKLAADLHIHSCLSPCGDMLMTPNNIVGMAYLKGLDVIAVSDHNTANNLPAIKRVADERGVLLLPAIEAESREEVHVLCYFNEVDAAVEFSKAIYEHLPDMPNNPQFFGEQVIMDEDDEPIGTEPRLLIQSLDLTIDELATLCRAHGGEPVPAHINRTSNSLINNLGFIPGEIDFRTVEIYRSLSMPEYIDTSAYHVLYSSDAHRLEDIFERDNFVSVTEKTVQSLWDYIRSKK